MYFFAWPTAAPSKHRRQLSQAPLNRDTRSTGNSPRAKYDKSGGPHLKIDRTKQKALLLKGGPTHYPAWLLSEGNTSALAIHLARAGKLAWA